MTPSLVSRLAVGATLTFCTLWAAATPVQIFVSPLQSQAGMANAVNAAQSWFTQHGLSPVVAENFESFTGGSRANAFATAVGTFTAGAQGQFSGGLGISPTGFSGRFNTTPGGSKWLDSYDYRTVTWSVDAGGATFSHIGFFLTDINDVAAQLTIAATGEMVNVSFAEQLSAFSLGKLPNGQVFFVGLSLGQGVQLETLTFSTGSVRNDGWGIDDVVLAQARALPEPGTLGLAGLAGLVLAGRVRRRRPTTA